MAGKKYIPQSFNLDIHDSLMPENTARFIKNLVHSVDDTSTATVTQGGQGGVYKPLESNKVYADTFKAPDGTVQWVGRASFKEVKEAFGFSYSAKGNHGIFRVNGSDGSIDTVMIDPLLNFQLNPENFISGHGSCWLEVVYISDPNTGEQKKRTFLFFTDSLNDQRFICVEDAIATKGFNPDLFPFFKGNYDRRALISMISPTPVDCITIEEVQLDQTSVQLSNDLLYNTWQWRIRWIDVWGRPSEYGIISDLYIPGGGGCIEASTNLPRCVNLKFPAPPPHINQFEVAFRNCNNAQWYSADTLDLYNGSPLGDWWTRSRNPDVNYDPNTGLITYQFCAQQGCDPIDETLTNRLENPIPRTSKALGKVSEYISLSNNKRGFLPFTKDLLKKITINVQKPSAGPLIARKAEIWCEIYNQFLAENEPIYQATLTGNNKVYAFGVFGVGSRPGTVPTVGPAILNNYKQYFINPNQQGFVGVLAGTGGAYVVSEQYSLTTDGVLTKITDFINLQRPGTNPKIRYFQKFTFTNLSPQKYVFRVIDHQTDPQTTPNYEKTSTYVRGFYGCNFSNPSNPVNESLIVDDTKELVIDLCNGDYDGMKDSKIMCIYDLAFNTAVRAGYVKNTNVVGQDQIGIELLRFDFTSPNRIDSRFTDHNGFFFCATQASGHGSTYNIYGYCNCRLINLTGGIDTGSTDRLQIDNWYLASISSCPDYGSSDCNFILIKGKVLICGSEVGVPNVGVVMARGGVAYTNNDGEFTIIAHDSAITGGPRIDNLYFIASSCPFTDCNGNCIVPLSVTVNKCVSCNSREVDVADTFVKFVFLKGLLSGGTYPIGVCGGDWGGRRGFIEPLGNFTMPSIYETQVFSPSQLLANIAADAVFSLDWDYITFWIGQENSIADYVDWIVDTVQFIDNTGKENDAAPTQIKIFYSSLIEYNKQNNFNTTVNWSFLEALPGSTTQTPVTTDRVQFLLNGDGTFFTKNIVSLVKYDQTGQFFLINYTPDLAVLKANARIRLFRPKVCTTTAPYFELCSTIKLKNGKPVVNSTTLNAFDTYYINRGIIPVPVAQATDPVTYINEPRLQGLPFEHNSPSDFWGLGCANLGRVNIKNDQETVLYMEDETALSDTLSPTGQLNFLCFFETARVFNFPDAQINGITALIAKPGIVLVIGVDDHFVVGFNDNLLRINNDGTAQAGSILNAFGQPQRKAGQDWGCQLLDKMTIYEKEGLVHWLDTTKTVIVQHNFSSAVNLAKWDPATGIPGGVDSWIRPKIKEIQNFNIANGPIRYWHGVVNPQNMEYMLSDFTIGSNNNVNNSRQPDVTLNETMAINIFSRLWRSAYSCTPELFTEIEGELTAQQLFAIWKGIPYSHYNDLEVKSYGQMFGQNIVRVLEPVVTIDNLLKKKPLAIGVICKQSQYFVDRATNEGGQETRMLLSQWIQAVYGWYAAFLCDLNTPFDPNRPKATGINKLTDGDMLVGNYIKVRLIGDPAKDNVYSELQGVLISIFADGNNLTNK